MKSWWKPPELRIDENSEAERHATWLELFYDLIFVVIISELAHKLEKDSSPLGFLGFVVLFVPVWSLWVGTTFYATRFDTDDLGHRLLTAIQIVAIAGLAANVHHGLSETSAGFALFYAGARTVLVIEYLRARRYVRTSRSLTTRFAWGFGIAAAIWLMSVFVPIPLRFLFWAVGLIVDFATPLLAGKLDVEFAPHSSHLPERFGLFTLIVLGELIVEVVSGVASQQWNVSSAVSAVLGLGIAFSIWWIYFDNLAGSAIQAARTCQRIHAYQTWLYMHLPLVIGLSATAVSVKYLVSSTPNLEIASGLRWLLCGAVALCLLALGIIFLTGLTPKTSQRCRLRATYRFGGAAFLILLALLGAGLWPAGLIGLVTLVCATQVILDLRDVITLR